VPESTNERTPRDMETGRPAVASLHLVLRFHQGGGVDVVSASEVAGRSVVSNAAVGDYVVEVVASAETLSIQGIPDPFEVRGSGGPDVPPSEGRASEATVMVRIPGVGLASPELDSLEVRLLRARTGGEAIGRLTPEVLDGLRRAGKVETIASAPAGALAGAIREKGSVSRSRPSVAAARAAHARERH
jgi:hypothetical protein